MLGINNYLIKKGCGGRIRQELTDFQVEEILPYEFNNRGEFVIVKIEKKGLSTFEARNVLAKGLGVKNQQVSYAGLKDKNAVTRQFLSIHGIDQKLLDGFEHDKIRVLEIHRHSRKVKIGKLYANKFKIIIRDCNPELGKKNFDFLKEKGVPNVIGWQRFGGRNGDTHIIGEGMIKKGMVNGIATKEKGLKWLYVTAFQSKIFNEILNERMKIGLDVRKGDLIKNYYGIKCSSSLFPGYKTPLAEGEQGIIEKEILNKNGVELNDFKKVKVEGKRRSNLFPLWDTDCKKLGKGVLGLEFTIPKGCFATAVLREVMGKDMD